VTTQGFLNQPRSEAPGTLLSRPSDNGSLNGGRTTSINYMNGWIIVGFEEPGSASGSDFEMRVYDISNPSNPIRRLPSDFGHSTNSYPGNRWSTGNFGFNAHGTAKTGSFLIPEIVRVENFGGVVELGGRDGVPSFNDFPLGFNRASQAGPWSAEMTWYGGAPGNFFIGQHFLNDSNNFNTQRVLASINHTGQFGGGDWHPMFFGDLLIYASSGGGAVDGGVVVYKLNYNNFDDPNQNNRSITPQVVGALTQGFSGYWPTFYSDGQGLYVVGSTSGSLRVADISQAVDPDGNGTVTMANTMNINGFTNSSYPTYQGDFAFIHNHKFDMSRFVQGEDESSIVLSLPDRDAGVDTSQYSLALGNLWLTGGLQLDFLSMNQGFAVWTHQQAADTEAPEVSFHIPQVDRTNYPRFAPLSFMIQEHLGGVS